MSSSNSGSSENISAVDVCSFLIVVQRGTNEHEIVAENLTIDITSAIGRTAIDCRG